MDDSYHDLMIPIMIQNDQTSDISADGEWAESVASKMPGTTFVTSWQMILEIDPSHPFSTHESQVQTCFQVAQS